MDEWVYDTSADFNAPLIERLRRFPREPDMLAYGLRSAAALWIRASLRIYHRFGVIGRAYLPRTGSFVMVANHSSHLDALALLSVLPLSKLHRAFPAAAADYFFASLPRTALAAVVINALPFDRVAGFSNSLQVCRELLANPGNILILFPEGTRSTTGRMGSFKPGIGMLLAGSNVPVLSCYLEGAYAAWPKGKRLPRPRRIRLKIGAPRSFEHYAPGKESAQAITRELWQSVADLATSD